MRPVQHVRKHAHQTQYAVAAVCNLMTMPQSQRPNQISMEQLLKLFIADVRLPKTRSLEGCSIALGRQPQTIGPQSCCRSTRWHKSSCCQNAADDDLLQTTAEEGQRPGRPEPCQTSNGGPRWLSWSPAVSEQEPVQHNNSLRLNLFAYKSIRQTTFVRQNLLVVVITRS